MGSQSLDGFSQNIWKKTNKTPSEQTINSLVLPLEAWLTCRCVLVWQYILEKYESRRWQSERKGELSREVAIGSQYEPWLSSLPLSKRDTSLIATSPTPHSNLHLSWPRLASRQACHPVRHLGPVQALSRCKHQNSHRLSPSHRLRHHLRKVLRQLPPPLMVPNVLIQRNSYAKYGKPEPLYT